jgi:membrane protease YdiL (CAAX protease family)
LEKFESTEHNKKTVSDMWLATAAATVPIAYILAQFHIIHSTKALRQAGCGKFFLTMNQILAPQLFMLIGVVAAAVIFGKTAEFRGVCSFSNWRIWFIPLAFGLEIALFIPFSLCSWLSLSLIKACKPVAPETVDVMLKLSETLQNFIKNSDWATFGLLAFAAVIVAPVVEEIVFRGILFNYLHRRLGMVGGVVSTSLVFAVFHLNAVSFLVLFALGVVLQLLYIRTKSIFSCMLFHSAHNAVAIGILCVVKALGR